MNPLRVVPALALLTLGSCTPPSTPPEPCDGFTLETPVRATPGARGFMDRAHAHNDYEHPRPLLDALEQGFTSVEVDAWPVGNAFRVGHWPWELQGTLEEMYLDVLQERVDAMGSVRGDGEAFTLWVDLKAPAPGEADRLVALLERYTALTVFGRTGVIQRPVTVVLTGDDATKRAVVERPGEVRAARDSNDHDPSDDATSARWTHHALAWGDYFPWDGTGEFPSSESRRLACVVNGVHARGRKVRFYAAPDTPAAWGVQLDHGVDLVNTDKLAELSAFLRARAR